jgi:hypothetical protein
MREKNQKQILLMESASDPSQAKELEIISDIIDSTLFICKYVLQDLNRGKIIKRRTGARGMSTGQILRATVVIPLFEFTYEQLAFHISSSWSCNFGANNNSFILPIRYPWQDP